MEQVEISPSLRCPDHKSQFIGMLNINPGAKKIAYCYECIEKTDEDGAVIKALKSLPSYLKENSRFYENCRQRAQSIGEPPANYIEEFSKKGECLEKFSKYIDQEKEKVKRSFEEIRKALTQIINQKEKECLQLLDKEILGLSEAYLQFEKLLSTGWPKPSDIQAMYPELDVLMQKISRIDNVDQLQAFMAGVQDDIQREKAYGMDEDGLERRKSEIDRLIRCFNIPDSSFPKAKSNFLVPEDFEGLMKEFIQQPTQMENSILVRVSEPSFESKIISDEQLRILKGWLPQGYNFDLKLLFRGSTDGMSSEAFHQSCDNKGATITLIKCRFDGAAESSTFGGFLDQSWHSNGRYSVSKEAFLFSLAKQSGNSVKCPILQTKLEYTFYGRFDCGPIFGVGHDLYIHRGLATGNINPTSYSNSIALQNGHGHNFKVEEIEVYQVL